MRDIVFGPAEVLWAPPGTDPADLAAWMTVGETLVWEPGARSMAERWRGVPVGLEEAAQRAVARFEYLRRCRAVARYLAAQRIAAQVIDPRSIIRITGL